MVISGYGICWELTEFPRGSKVISRYGTYWELTEFPRGIKVICGPGAELIRIATPGIRRGGRGIQKLKRQPLSHIIHGGFGNSTLKQMLFARITAELDADFRRRFWLRGTEPSRFYVYFLALSGPPGRKAYMVLDQFTLTLRILTLNNPRSFNRGSYGSVKEEHEPVRLSRNFPPLFVTTHSINIQGRVFVRFQNYPMEGFSVEMINRPLNLLGE
ncbi:hypothetical protein VNO77_22130 [Canavalia gladiata]|uniref:Uncharacterized protein n=1 Tax=Canavalia gladiata TaxID=3824 RepID=A0AAN9L314_CANGL